MLCFSHRTFLISFLIYYQPHLIQMPIKMNASFNLCWVPVQTLSHSGHLLLMSHLCPLYLILGLCFPCLMIVFFSIYFDKNTRANERLLFGSMDAEVLVCDHLAL